jgi:adenosylmethionine---8-amino-7-oxononanoate aminotransferase
MTELLKKDRAHVWHPFTQMKTAGVPLEIVSAKGTVLTTADGSTYIDANSSWWVNVHGHGNERLAKAISDQFMQLDHVIFAGATHPPAVELATQIVGLLGDPFSKVFFSDDGSTAVEVALKMVFQYWHNAGVPKKRILALDGAYHGDTFGAMAIGQRGYFNEPFEHFFFDVDFLDFPVPEREEELLNKAKQLFETGEFAGLIVEPLVQGSAGMRMYSADFLGKLLEIAKNKNVLVIFDEVMTAWGRTGKLFAMEYISSKPDIVCLSKGLTGGVLPLGLTVATEAIFEGFLFEEKTKALLHGHSFTGNALSCAAANESIRIFKEDETWAAVKRISDRHIEFKNKISSHPNVENVRILGTILALDIKVGEVNGYFSSIRDRIYDHMLNNGILLRPLGNCVFVNPPYCITNEELDKVYNSIESFIHLLKNE